LKRPQRPGPPAPPLRIMGRLVRRGVKPAGTPPGTVVHAGPRRVIEPELHALVFGPNHLNEVRLGSADPLPSRPDDPAEVLWLNVMGLHDVGLLERVGRPFGIHPLALEDVAHVGQRPKLEAYDEHLFLVLPMLTLSASGHIEVEQISMVVGRGFLVTFQEAPGDVLEPVRARLRSGRGKIRNRGTDFLVYTLLDALVDATFHVLEGLGEQMEALESWVLSNPSAAAAEGIQRVHELRRELLVMRRSVWPLREVVAGFQRVDPPFVEPNTQLYLRDVYDHCHQLMDSIELLREMAQSLHELHLSTINNRMNEVMKVLTVMASIFIPLTFIAGVYGMNFEHMPELGVPWAYPAVLAAMGGVAFAMLLFFRVRRWI
jgi:magnesium transporter